MPVTRRAAAVVVSLAIAAFAGLATPLVPGASPFAAHAGDLAKRAPDPKAGTDVYEWTSAGGVTCAWRAPASYDAAKGANLTVILHGSNLSHLWGFANHDPKTFRTDDFVLVPDGTSAAGANAFNFLPADTKKVRALLDEIRKVVKVRALFLYGHSQGSFFSLAYAGEFPEEVQGVVAHASGIWASSQRGPKAHHQAVVFLHGTQDPVVPYVQSEGGFEALRKANYPTLKLRSLEGWNHWPAELNGVVPHTSQQLAWVEGMTTADPDRLRVSFEKLAEPNPESPGEHDYAGLWSLAKRIGGLAAAPDELKERAAKAQRRVEDLAAAHVAALALPEKLVFEPKPWIGHLPVFLRAFAGVPARDDLAKRVDDVLAAHRKAASPHVEKYYAALKQGKADDAFEAGALAIQSGFLWTRSWDAEMRNNLKQWHADPKKHKLGKAAMKAYDETFDALEAQIRAGWDAFEAVCRKF